MTASVQADFTERRRLSDRRDRPTPPLSSYSLQGRREGFRRRGEGFNRYADCVRLEVACLVIVIAALNALDALLTLYFIQDGGGEWNPAMAVLIGRDLGSFLWVKLGITFLGLVILSLHQYFRGVRFILWLCAGLYSLVFALHTAIWQGAIF